MWEQGEGPGPGLARTSSRNTAGMGSAVMDSAVMEAAGMEAAGMEAAGMEAAPKCAAPPRSGLTTAGSSHQQSECVILNCHFELLHMSNPFTNLLLISKHCVVHL
jgi:hypothetical protein